MSGVLWALYCGHLCISGQNIDRSHASYRWSGIHWQPHCCASACAAKAFVLVDNFSNSNTEILKKIARVTGSYPRFAEIDIANKDQLNAVFDAYEVDGVIHLSGLKAVGESHDNPLIYYHNNLSGTITLLSAMKEVGVKRMVFSSSATVYGKTDEHSDK